MGVFKIMGTFLGVFRIGIIWGLNWGPPMKGNFHIESGSTRIRFQRAPFRETEGSRILFGMIHAYLPGPLVF